MFGEMCFSGQKLVRQPDFGLLNPQPLTFLTQKVKMAKDAPKSKGRDGRKKVDKKTHVTREYTINFGKQLKGR